MNKHLFRVIFNKKRGTFIAVAETVSGHGKDDSSKTGVATPLLPLSRFADIALFIAALFGGVTIVHAQIVSDKKAPGNQRPIIDNTANGKPLVQIVTPNSKGLSHNKYKAYNVNSGGAILNNSGTAVLTDKGGYVPGNANLVNGSARVILNEITGTSASSLKGYTEVAGQQAEVIIANPNGISCDGCGFINTSRGVLTTGTPVFGGDGSLSAFRVTQGNIQIGPNGLNGGNTGQIDLLARSIEVNGTLWADKLNAVAGANQINYANLGVQVIAGQGNQPTVAIDVGQLGGMYANKIRLIGTEAGVGVNSNGTLTAAQNFTLDNAGNITLQKGATSGGDLAIKSNGSIVTQGKLSAANNLSLQATDAIDSNDQQLLAGNDLAIKAKKLNNVKGQIKAGNDLKVALQSNYTYSQGDVIAAGNDIAFDTSGNFTNQNELTAGNALKLHAANIDNQKDGVINASTVVLKADNAFANTGAVFGDDIAIGAQSVSNDKDSGATQAGVIAARGTLDVGASTIVNREGASLYSEGDMTFGGSLDANNKATGEADSLLNASARIETDGNLALHVAAIENRNDHFATEDRIVEQGPHTQYQGEGSSNRYDSSQVGDVRCDPDDMDCKSMPDGVYQNYTIFNFTRTITNTFVTESAPAEILASKNMDFTGSVINDKSRIIAGGDLTGTANSIVNIDGIGHDITTDSGTAQRTYTEWHGGFRRERTREWDGTASYAPAPTVVPVNLGIVAKLANTAPIGNANPAEGQQPLVAALPTSLLYQITKNPKQNYVIESDPRFINHHNFLSSDYMLGRMAMDPQLAQKRLGDGYYEQKLINDQIVQLTNKKSLGYASAEDQYKALMDAGVATAQQFNLIPGVALTSAQMAALTSDIVWLVEQSLTLPDGRTEKVLAPVVYLSRVNAADIKPSGALIAANNIDLKINGTLENGGTLQAGKNLSITATDIRNAGGTLRSNATDGSTILVAANDVDSLSGKIEGNRVGILAGRDVNLATRTIDTVGASGTRTGLDTASSIVADQLSIQAGRDITAAGAQLTTTGDAALVAGRDIQLKAVTAEVKENIVFSSDNHLKQSRSQVVGTQIQGGGNVTLIANQDIKTAAASINSDKDLTIAAGRDVQLDVAKQGSSFDEKIYRQSSGFLSSSSSLKQTVRTDTQAIGSELSGDNVAITAGRDLAVIGSNINAINGATLAAGRDVAIAAATENHTVAQMREDKKSGLSGSLQGGVSFGNSQGRQTLDGQSTTVVNASVSGSNVQIAAARDVGVIGSAVLADNDIRIDAGRNINIDAAQETETTVTTSKQSGSSFGLMPSLSGSMTIYGTTSEKQEGQGNGTNSITSLLSANAGNLTMVAGNANTTDATITSHGADLLAGKTITMEADRIALLASRDTTDSSSRSESKSFTVGARPAGTVGGAIYAVVDQAVRAAEGTGNDRLDGALALKAGYDTYKLIANSQKIADSVTNAAGAAANADPSGSAFGVSVSIGSAESKSETTTASTQVTGTNLQAKDIDLKARKTDIEMEAAKLQAERIQLQAARDVLLKAGANTSEMHSKNSSSSASVGATIGIGQQSGISFQLGMQQGKGKANGEETTYDNTLITATEKVTIKSGADTTLQGAQIAAREVTMDVGKNLTIESLQDSSKYESEQKSSGFGISLCIPPICYGASSASINMSDQSIKHNYQSAQGQSGIAAGEKGFDITVGKRTDLTGAAITSTADQSKNKLTTETLTSRDLVNKQDTDAKSSSFSASASANFTGGGAASAMSQLAQNGAANVLGNLTGQTGLPENNSETSQTQSVISPATITLTGNAEQNKQGQETVALLTSRDPEKANAVLTNTLTLQQTAALEQELKTTRQNQEAAQLVGSVLTNVIGDYAKSQTKTYDEASLKKKVLEGQLAKATDPATRSELEKGITEVDATLALNQDKYDMWKDGGVGKIGLHGLAGYLEGRISGGPAGAAAFAAVSNEALSAAVNNAIAEAIASDKTGGSKNDAATAKAYGEAAATLIGSLAGALTGGKDGAAIGGSVALIADQNNRQLHPSEEKWLKDKAKEFAKKEGISEQQALERLTQQALKDVDYLWRAQLADGDDTAAQAFLKTNQTFTNDLGEQQKLFTAQGQQLFRPEMFGDIANPAFYKQFAQSGISRGLTEGLMKEFKDSGVNTASATWNLAKAVKDNPGAALDGLWSAVKGLPQSVIDGFQETGHAIGEGAAVGLNKDLTDKLNAIYGTDTSGLQQAMLAIRTLGAITGAAGVAKAGADVTEKTAVAIGKKLDQVAAAKAEAKVIADRMKDLAINKDGDRFTVVAEMMGDAKEAGWKKTDGTIWYPPENGKVPGSGFKTTLDVGTKLDRYGDITLDTDFLALAGTPYAQRALPTGSDTRPLITLKVVKPLPVEQSNVMPWFGQPGMGIQYQTTSGSTGLTVNDLIKQGYLEVVSQ